MNTMAIPLSNEPEDAPRRQKITKNRQVSLYATRLKTEIPAFPTDLALPNGTTTPSESPSPSIPIMPRWDSLQNGAHVLQQSPTSATFPLNIDAAIHDTPEVPPLPPTLINSAVSSPVESTFPPSSRNSRHSHSSRRLTGQTSHSSLRQDGNPIENFSRPRKPSIKQPLVHDSLKSTPSNIISPELAQELASSLPQTPPWQRSRGPSVSSFKSTSTVASPPQANGELPRASNLSTNPTSVPVRPPFGLYSRVDSSQSAPAGAIGTGAPWLSGDESRASFRSQLTASTAPGTAATERSSVMTKDSSVSSNYANNDEPSLEDVMHMYEKGFADDTDEEHTSDSDANLNSRPVTALSELGPIRRTIGVSADSDAVPPLPDQDKKALAVQIRQSKLIFSSPDFISKIPAVSGENSSMTPIKEKPAMEKRDSAKSIASDPSVTSDSKGQEGQDAADARSVSPISETHSSSQPDTTPAPAPAPTSAFMSSEVEDPGSRDRYGFKKANQYITREQYDEWNKGYTQFLGRRRRKWVQYLRDCALMTDRPIRFPPPNAKTKRFVRKGIPPDWRGAAWFYYAGGPAILGKNSGLYVKLLQQEAKQIDVEAIERDLHRTFPDNIQFKFNLNDPSSGTNSERHSQNTLTGTDKDASDFGPRGNAGEPPIITSLRRVLHAFSIYNPRIGYCQSLNFLAGLLLLFVETEENCFWLLNVITHIYLPGTHEMSLEGSKVDLSVLMAEIRDTMPEVWDKIGGELEGELAPKPAARKSIRRPQLLARHKTSPSLSTERLPPITLCMTAWFMSCYIGTLPIETTLRVWDVFFYEGSKTLFRIAMAIFKQGEPEIRSLSDPMEMFGVVQSMPRKMLDANGLLELCFKRRNGFNHLNQDVIDGRRQERRDKARKEKEQGERGRSATNGYTTEGEADGAELRRKGTLFSRRKRTMSRARPAEA